VSLLTAFYDLERGPVSFDFVTWLVRALMERDARACSALHVVVVPKEDGLGGFSRNWGPHDEHAARWRLWHIVAASCPLARATLTIAHRRAQAERLCHGAYWWPPERVHLVAPIMAAARKGVSIPLLGATEGARRYVRAWLAAVPRPVVTLTLRSQENDPARNAAVAEWAGLECWLAERGYEVVTLNDTNLALARGHGYAELDPDLRLALYERAEMNVVGNNGPAALLWHSAAPYLRVGAGIPADWGTNLGLAQGEQVPWARPGQRLVYGPDTFDVMREAFTTWAGATS
jgi:hypothetical protein